PSRRARRSGPGCRRWSPPRARRAPPEPRSPERGPPCWRCALRERPTTLPGRCATQRRRAEFLDGPRSPTWEWPAPASSPDRERPLRRERSDEVVDALAEAVVALDELHADPGLHLAAGGLLGADPAHDRGLALD